MKKRKSGKLLKPDPKHLPLRLYNNVGCFLGISVAAAGWRRMFAGSAGVGYFASSAVGNIRPSIWISPFFCISTLQPPAATATTTATTTAATTAMTTISPTPPSLTTNDSAVLQALFDAESSPSNSSTNVQINDTLTPFPSSLQISPEKHTALQSRELSIIKSLQSTDSPNKETIQSAVSELSTLISEEPNYPPAYVNRAQALRILIETIQNGGSETETEVQNASTTLFKDLSTAITLLSPTTETPVSPTQARILADAHTHRGYLLLKTARTKRDQDQDTSISTAESWTVPEPLKRVSADQAEEMASREFFQGGQFGNEVARQLAVQTNPYAKMCGAIVKEAMRKEVEGVGS